MYNCNCLFSRDRAKQTTPNQNAMNNLKRMLLLRKRIQHLKLTTTTKPFRSYIIRKFIIVCWIVVKLRVKSFRKRWPLSKWKTLLKESAKMAKWNGSTKIFKIKTNNLLKNKPNKNKMLSNFFSVVEFVFSFFCNFFKILNTIYAHW